MMMLMALAVATGQVSTPPSRPQARHQPGRPGMGQGGPGMDGKGLDRFFDMVDTDRNGQLSKAEFRAAHERMRQRRGQGMQPRPGERPR